MKFLLRTIIISQLSDIQELICFPNSAEKIRMRVNYVKMLVFKLDEGVKEITETELDELWKECNERFGL